MRISVFAIDANPAIDAPAFRRSRNYVIELLDSGDADILDGKSKYDTLAVKLRANLRVVKARIAYRLMNWNHVEGRMRQSVLNEGRVGQFPIGYPYPPASVPTWRRRGRYAPLRQDAASSE